MDASHTITDQDLTLRVAAVSRIVAALMCLALHLSGGPGHQVAVSVACTAYLAWAAALFFLTRQPWLPLLRLSAIIDAVFFLVYAAFGREPHGLGSAMLYAFLLASTFVILSSRDMWVVVGTCALFLSLVPLKDKPGLRAVVYWSAATAIPIGLYKKRLEESLKLAQRSLAEQDELVRKTREAERQKLAGDFHDGPLQAFIGLEVRMEVISRLLERDPQAAARELRELQAIARAQIAEMRAFLRGMRPVEAGQADLTTLVRNTIAEFEKNTSLKIAFQTDPQLHISSPEKAAELVQIVREALNNIRKHARASRASVTLRKAENAVEITVEDNGVGFPFSGTFDLEEMWLLHIGPLSIQHRVRALEGAMVLESRPGQGSTLRVKIPL